MRKNPEECNIIAFFCLFIQHWCRPISTTMRLTRTAAIIKPTPTFTQRLHRPYGPPHWERSSNQTPNSITATAAFRWHSTRKANTNRATSCRSTTKRVRCSQSFRTFEAHRSRASSVHCCRPTISSANHCPRANWAAIAPEPTNISTRAARPPDSQSAFR